MMEPIVLLTLLSVFLIGVTEAGTKITVYQSPLTYYDVEHREGGWLETSAVEKEIPFSSRFECQFITLPFEFPYYADKITRLGVTRLGFVYTGPYTNARLTELMHIAPLMNLYTFNSGNVTQATVLNEGKSIYVLQWNNISILNYTATFQLQLHLNGTMVFAYQNISSEVLNMAVVSVVSAFPWVNSAAATKDLTYYEYEEVKLSATEDVINGSSLVLSLRENCQFGTNCSTCTEIAATTPFSCQWCSTLRRCSDTFDSRYEDWASHCSSTKTEATECAAFNEEATEEPTPGALGAVDAAVDSFTSLGEWLESLLSEGVLAYDSGSCSSAGQFWNPFTASCNDCIYCASSDCQEACANADSTLSTRTDPRQGMKVKEYNFRNQPKTSPYKSAFIGMVAGLAVCLSVALMFTCLKRRSYSTPNGPGGMWTIPQDPNVRDDKPLIYGTGSDGLASA